MKKEDYLYYNENDYELYKGKMQDVLSTFEANSVDSIVCDPPYELNFMGKGWDNSGVAFQLETWKHCFDVLKEGGYLLAFGGTRTFHRIACAIEDAGFEIRDTIMWLYGSGFPKSMSLSKGIEAREKLGNAGTRNKRKIEQSCNTEEYNLKQTNNGAMGEIIETTRKKYIPNTELAEKWSGWGTCLKPAYEPVIVARKPFKGSLVDNVIKNGVGGINIDECRIPTSDDLARINKTDNGMFGVDNNNNNNNNAQKCKEQGIEYGGRFPANVILTYDETDFEEVCGGMPDTKSTYNKDNNHQTVINRNNADILKYGYKERIDTSSYNDEGSASRYFMNCKYNRKDEDIWKNLFVNNVETNLEIILATKENIVQINVEELLKKLKDHYAKYVENQQELIETSIVQDIVKILSWDFKIETSKVIQDFIINYDKCIQFLNLVQFVEKMDNIDTTPTTQNLLKLFGYVKVAITNYILGNVKLEQKRYLYTPKASKKDRDEGLDLFEESLVNDGRKKSIDNAFQRGETPRKNVHPTVKPVELMQYLVRLVTPKGGTIMDCFMGSGSTGKAVMFENRERNANYKFIGVEMTEEYLPICHSRIDYAKNKYEYDLEKEIEEFKKEKEEQGYISLFDL